MAEKKKQLTASASFPAAQGRYWGYVVVAPVATDDIKVYDGNKATGLLVDVVPKTATIGQRGLLVTPIKIDKGIEVDFGLATGRILFLYD